MQEAFLQEYALQIAACETFSLRNRSSASSEDPFQDGFASVEHLLCQLNSISAVTALWRDSGVEYDAVLYLRPDVLFNCELPVELLDDLQPHTAYLADFAHWRGGWNDRFLLATPAVADVWGERCGAPAFVLLNMRIATETPHVELVD